MIEESRKHVQDKFGKNGYAKEKMYFEDLDYQNFLQEAAFLSENKGEFRKRFIEINKINELKFYFDEVRKDNPNMSLDEVLYKVYEKVKDKYNKPFDILRNIILDENGIDEIDQYTKNVSQDLKDYIKENPENMFYEDQTYKVFIQDMRDLLKRDDDFKNRYCEVNHILSRSTTIDNESGELSYIKVLTRKQKIKYWGKNGKRR